MTTLDELIASLRAQLDEDEAAARAWLPFGNPTAAQREHIARHDPGRMLAEVAAKRAIVDLCATETDATGGKPLAVRILHLLAGAGGGSDDDDPR